MTGEARMTTRHEYIEILKQKLDEWEADIDKFEDLAEKTRTDLKFELEDQITSLKLKRDIAKLKLEEFRETGEEAWEELKAGAEEAWDDLKEAIEKARSHFH